MLSAYHTFFRPNAILSFNAKHGSHRTHSSFCWSTIDSFRRVPSHRWKIPLISPRVFLSFSIVRTTATTLSCQLHFRQAPRIGLKGVFLPPAYFFTFLNPLFFHRSRLLDPAYPVDVRGFLHPPNWYVLLANGQGHVINFGFYRLGSTLTGTFAHGHTHKLNPGKCDNFKVQVHKFIFKMCDCLQLFIFLFGTE